MNRGGVLNAALGGWQISTIGTFQKGSPFGVLVLNGPRDVLGDQADGKNLRPDIAGDPGISNRGTAAQGLRGIQWFNPDAFATPQRFTHCNVSRIVPGLLGPGIVSFDSLLAKNFVFWERFRLQYRWETFNTFNTPQFDSPNQVLGGGSSGVVTSAGGRPIMPDGAEVVLVGRR